MKVIDLLNKIANGEEVPEKIQVYSDIFVLDYGNKIYEHETTRTNLLDVYNGNILNYEVEVIEEDKKIEKVMGIDTRETRDCIITFQEKLNELIEEVNKLKESK